jgi:hypothetical protein
MTRAQPSRADGGALWTLAEPTLVGEPGGAERLEERLHGAMWTAVALAGLSGAAGSVGGFAAFWPVAAASALAAAGAVALGYRLAAERARTALLWQLSWQVGLRATYLSPVDRALAERQYGLRFPPGVRHVVELRVATWRTWARGDEPRPGRTRRAVKRFEQALAADCHRVLHDLLPPSGTWGLAISTWYRLPDWLEREAVVMDGPRPAWAARLAEASRRADQRRMFGVAIRGRVDLPQRWHTYLAAPGRTAQGCGRGGDDVRTAR